MRALLVIVGIVIFLALLGRDGGVSETDYRNSAEAKFLANTDREDFARTVIAASGHACARVTGIGPSVDIALTTQRLVTCANGGRFALGLSITDAAADAEPCRDFRVTVCD